MEVMERFWKTKKDIFCIAVMILFAVCVMGASFVMFMHGQDSYQIFCLCHGTDDSFRRGSIFSSIF